MKLCLVTLAAATLLAGAAVSQLPLYSVGGDGSGHRFGAAVSGAGDIDGDGFVDVIAGAPRDDDNGPDSGSVRVVSGRDQTLLFVLSGAAAGDFFGAAVAGAGDVNGDGRADFIVGAPGDGSAGLEAGSATVYSGLNGSVLYRIDGESPGDHLGGAVAGGGDLNADGYADFAAGAPFDDDGGLDSGSVVVFSGRDGSLLYRLDGVGAGDAFGVTISLAGDLNADCHDDLVVGAPFHDGAGGVDSGRVTVCSGLDGSVLRAFEGGQAGELFGWSVCVAGDLNDDGHAELLVGAPLHDGVAPDAGRAVAYSGVDGAELASFAGQAADQHFGWSVGGDADLNADGVAELIVGAPGPGSSTGSAWVYSGADGTLWRQLAGLSVGESFGTSVSGLGDVNRDGYPDLVVGAPQEQIAGAGRIDVFALAPYGSQAEVSRLTPAMANARFGARMSRAGDVNADGVEDYMVGATLDFGKLGSVRIYSGLDHSLIRLLVGPAFDATFGIRTAAVGDFDQDGYGDVIVGAYHDDTFNQDSGLAHVYSGRTGSILTSFFGTGFRSHLGTAVGALGDVDGDGVIDFFCGLGNDSNEKGKAQVFSGATGTVLYEVTATRDGTWLGWDGAALGDIDGDGICDFVVGAPSGRQLPTPGTGFVRILSGADGSLIRRVNGANPQDRFGWTVDAAGDVNADGVMDILVGSDGYDIEAGAEAGRAVVISGADFAILHNFIGGAPGDFFGRHVGPAGDINGDGFADVLVGAPGADPNGLVDAGAAYLYSGRDGTLLQVFAGEAAMDTLGTSLLGLRDDNGDGFGEVAIGVLLDGTAGFEAGSVRMFKSLARPSPGSSWIYGAACPGSTGDLPRIGIDGVPVAGGSFGVTLTSALASTVATLGFDLQQQQIGLGYLGVPQCSVLALHLLAVPVATDGMGKARLDIALPPGVTLPPVYGQWFVSDPTANSLGFVFSNAIEISAGL